MDAYLNEIVVQLPDLEIDNLALASRFDFTEDFIEGKLGFLRRRELGTDQSILSLLEAAAPRISDVQAVEAIVWVSQTSPYRGIPHLSAVAADILGLEKSALVFDLGLGCSGYPVALHLATSLLKTLTNESAEVLVITGDAYSKIIDPNDKDVALIFGDGLSITRVTKRPLGLGLKIGGVASHTSFSKALCAESGLLSMNGREVYNYVLTNVRPVVESCVELNGSNMDQVSRVYAHQGSRHIVRQVGRALRRDDMCCPFYSEKTGNMVSTSIPYGLVQLPPASGLSVLVGFGVGLQSAAILLEKSV